MNLRSYLSKISLLGIVGNFAFHFISGIPDDIKQTNLRFNSYRISEKIHSVQNNPNYSLNQSEKFISDSIRIWKSQIDSLENEAKIRSQKMKTSLSMAFVYGYFVD